MATNGPQNDCIGREIKDVSKPRRILLFSGKRKSGKDYITNLLRERIGEEDGIVIKLSAPIKYQWAKSKGLDFNELLSDSGYKEQFRSEMSRWGEDVRKNDYGYFCRAAIDMYEAYRKPIWIVSDARRKTDIQWFMENFGDACKTVRIVSDNSVRVKRGWKFTSGIDDAETECDLDDVSTWDLTVINNDKDIDIIMEQILMLIGQ